MNLRWIEKRWAGMRISETSYESWASTRRICSLPLQSFWTGRGEKSWDELRSWDELKRWQEERKSREELKHQCNSYRQTFSCAPMGARLAIGNFQHPPCAGDLLAYRTRSDLHYHPGHPHAVSVAGRFLRLFLADRGEEQFFTRRYAAATCRAKGSHEILRQSGSTYSEEKQA